MGEISNKIKIKMLQAGNGDSFFVTWKDMKGDHAILVDTGVSGTAPEIITMLQNHPNPIDAMIITHVDDDHVGGAIAILEENPEIIKEKVSKIIINAPETIEIDDGYDAGVSHGISFLTLLKRNKLEHLLSSATSDETSIIEFGVAKLTILSPLKDSIATKKLICEWKKELQQIKNEDLDASALKVKKSEKNTIAEYADSNFPTKLYPKSDYINGSSIAFVLEFEEKKILFLGDSHPIPVLASLKEKTTYKDFDCVKLSHHGSFRNISQDIVEYISAKKFIVSSNGKGHSHPAPETLSKFFIKNQDKESDEKIQFYFNYQLAQFGHLTSFCKDAESYSDLELIHPSNGEIEI